MVRLDSARDIPQRGGEQGSLADRVRNRGELAEGWYDPQTLEKARVTVNSPIGTSRKGGSGSRRDSRKLNVRRGYDENSDSDDSLGPVLPGNESQSRRRRVGPAIPNTQDLELKRGVFTSFIVSSGR